MNQQDQLEHSVTSSAAVARALAIGFGATALMWVLSYIAMLQPGGFIGEAIFGITVLVLVLGGVVAAMADASQSTPSVGPYSKDGVEALKRHRFDRAALGARELRYERLDQLTTEILCGVR